ncbi:MAG TPA: acetate--CoA ligase family protein [Syntrophorhabdales bacterium]|nr:acetate--CoA ligase family protein [Syntrophorhabdales bacterium]
MTEKTIFAELDPMFHPGSLAVIGASGKPGKIGRVLMDRLLETGFQKLYPVNPGESEILGIKAYRSILEIPDAVDMAIVLTPTDSALAAVTECAEKGVKTIVITTSGFGEAGEKGKAVQQEMVRVARAGGARVIGPNCVGIYCPASRLPYLLGAGTAPGSVGVVSQSGFFADYLTLTATGNGIRFSKAISCGNESDLTATDFLEYLGEDPETETIVAYLEGTADGRRFYHVAKEASRKKPIILWKGGLTETGARAAISHTGALAGSGRIWEGALRQAGIVTVASFEEALDCLYAFHLQPLPRGKRIGIISGPGGAAVGTTDRCFQLGLEVPQFSQDTIEKLRKAMPPVGGSINNPIDLSLASMVSPRICKDALIIATEDENIDMLLVISVVGGELLRDLMLEALAEMRDKKPFVVTVMAGRTQSVAQDLGLLLASGISAYPDASRAAKALARLSEYARIRESRPAVEGERIATKDTMRGANRLDVIETALKQGRTTLSEHESKEILRAYGIPVTREEEIFDERRLGESLARIGFPLVIKASGPSVSHKTEQGLVHTGIRNEHEAVTAFRSIMNRAEKEGLSVLVQEMVEGRRELVVGLTRDAQFGPCVMFGLGGIFTEVLQDIAFRVAPIERTDALEMLGEIKARKILEAFRGMPAAEIDRLADIVTKVSRIGIEQPAIKEIDINPVILSQRGPVAVDALIVLNR